MEIDQIIARNLKRLREQQNLSFDQLAEKSGVSKVMLSQLEKGGANPTINNIWKIANALKVPYTELLDSKEIGADVIRKNQVAEQKSDDEHYRLFCYYTVENGRNFELFRMELDSASSYISQGHKENSVEYVIIQSGVLEIETQNKKFVLEAGDSICFKADSKHKYINSGEKTAAAYVINFFPS